MVGCGGIDDGLPASEGGLDSVVLWVGCRRGCVSVMFVCLLWGRSRQSEYVWVGYTFDYTGSKTSCGTNISLPSHNPCSPLCRYSPPHPIPFSPPVLSFYEGRVEFTERWGGIWCQIPWVFRLRWVSHLRVIWCTPPHEGLSWTGGMEGVGVVRGRGDAEGVIVSKIVYLFKGAKVEVENWGKGAIWRNKRRVEPLERSVDVFFFQS